MKKFLSLILSFVLVFSVFSVIPFSASATGILDEWMPNEKTTQNGQIQVVTEDGVEVVKGVNKNISQNQVIALDYFEQPTGVNTVEFDFRVDTYLDRTSSVSTGVGTMYNIEGGKYVYMYYSSKNKRFIINNSGSQVAQSSVIDITEGDWHRFKVVHTADECAIFYDGQKVAYYKNMAYTFESSTKITIRQFQVIASYKNIKASEERYNLLDHWTPSDTTQYTRSLSGDGWLTSITSGSGRFAYDATKGDGGCAVQFDAKIDSLVSSGGNFGFIWENNVNKYFFFYSSSNKKIAIGEMPASTTYELVSKAIDLNDGKYHSFEFSVYEGEAAFVLDGAKELSYTGNPTHGASWGTFNPKNCRITCYNTNITFKNLTIGNYVTFLDNNGEFIEKVFVESGKSVPGATLDEISEALPDVPDFDKVLDSDGKQVWSEDISQVNGNMTVMPLYEYTKGDYTLSGWTPSDTTQYTHSLIGTNWMTSITNGSGRFTYDKTSGDGGHQVSFDARIDGIVSSGGNFGFIWENNVNKYFFFYSSVNKRIAIGEMPVSTTYELASKSIDLNDGKFHSFKFTVSDDDATFLLDGEEELSYVGKPTHGSSWGTFDPANCRITCYNTKITFKNLTIGDGPLPTYNIHFLDISGRSILDGEVDEGECIPESLIREASEKLPEIYGYEKYLDENGLALWNNNITEPVFSDIVLKPYYKRSNTRYPVKIKYSDNTETTVYKRFDDLLTISDKGATGFKCKGEFIASTDADGFARLFVSGGMELTATTDTAPSEASVNIVNETTDFSENHNNYNVFAHLYNPKGKEVKECGISYISSTLYNMLTDGDKAIAWKDINPKNYGNRTAANAIIAINGRPLSDFLTTLQGISVTTVVTRYAQAFVTFSDNTTIVSNPVYHTFNSYQKNTYTESTLDYKYIGRKFVDTENDTIILDMPATGIEFEAEMNGNIDLNVTVSDSDATTQYFVVTVDGVPQYKAYGGFTRDVPKDITMTLNLTSNIHTIGIYRRTERAYTGKITINSITFTGTNTGKPQNTDEYIEFVGDSITGGIGNDYDGYHHNSYLSFATITARALGMDYALVSNSGATLTNQSGRVCMKDKYDYVTNFTNTAYNHSIRPADYVVINLGTNDRNFDYMTNDLFETKAEEFARHIIEVNKPTTKIIFAYGLMGSTITSGDRKGEDDGIAEIYERIAEKLQGEGKEAYFCLLPTNMDGYQTHPTVAGQQAAAEVLTAFIKEIQ